MSDNVRSPAEFVAALDERVRARRAAVRDGAEPDSVAVQSPADAAAAVSDRQLSHTAVLVGEGSVDRVGVDRVGVDRVGVERVELTGLGELWPDGVLAAEDLSWVVSGDGAQRTLLILT